MTHQQPGNSTVESLTGPLGGNKLKVSNIPFVYKIPTLPLSI